MFSLADKSWVRGVSLDAGAQPGGGDTVDFDVIGTNCCFEHTIEGDPQ